MEVDDDQMNDRNQQSKMNRTYKVTNNRTDRSSTPIDHNDSVILIPETPSPVFSRFAGKRDRNTDLDKFNHCARKKARTNLNGFGLSGCHSNNNEKSKNSHSHTNSPNKASDMNNSNIRPSDGSSQHFNNLWDEWMREADSLPCFNRNKSHKKSFNEKLKNGKRASNFSNRFMNDSFRDEIDLLSHKPKQKIETVTQSMELDTQPECSRKKSCDMINSYARDKNVGQRSGSGVEGHSSHNDGRNDDANSINDKFAQLKMARQKKIEKALESLSEDEYMELPSSLPHKKKQTPKKFKFNHLHWPSDSESNSDSDNSDTVPLREILGENLSHKKKKPVRKYEDQACRKNKDHACTISETNSSSLDKYLQRKETKEKNLSKPRVANKSATVSNSSHTHPPDTTRQNISSEKNSPTPNRVRSRGPNPFPADQHDQDISVISSSSAESPVNQQESNITLNSTSEDLSLLTQDQSINTSFRPTFISPRLPVPGSVRRGRHLDRRLERHLEEIDDSPITLIADQVQPSASVSPPVRDPRSLSPHLLNRSRSSRSHKGRLSRTRNLSRERVVSHGTDFTSASALLTPRSHDAVAQVRQHQDDEEFARLLQEEMDREFALSLHNMENRPPEENSRGSTTTDEDSSEARNDNTRSRMYGLEEIEAFLQLPDEANPNLELLRASMSTTPPRARNRQRGSRRQRTSNSLEALSRMEAHLMSILNDYGDSPVRGQNRRGRRLYLPPFNNSAEEGQDYEDLWNLVEIMGEVKQRGLSKHQVTKLPERKYQICPGEDVKECLVCMCEFAEKEVLRILPCFHEFHSPCIDKWITVNATCPVCRVEVQV